MEDGRLPLLGRPNWTELLRLPPSAAQSRAAARGEREKAFAASAYANLVFAKGEQHEDAYLAQLIAAGRDVATIELDRDGGWDWARAARETEQALRDGRGVIYQAALVDGDWRGLADFVERRADGSYEVVDTKLARHAKPSHIFQLCFYSTVVARLQGHAPEWMHVELGSGERESFRVADFDAYYRLIRDRFVRAAGSSAETYPWPSWTAPCARSGTPASSGGATTTRSSRWPASPASRSTGSPRPASARWRSWAPRRRASSSRGSATRRSPRCGSRPRCSCTGERPASTASSG